MGSLGRGGRALRILGWAGAVVVVLSGCSDPPTRERTPFSALIEITDATTARVTIQSNEEPFFFVSTPSPRGAPPTLIAPSTTATRPLTHEELNALLAEGVKHLGEAPSLELAHPTVTVAEVARVVADGAEVTTLEQVGNVVTATVRFPRLASTVKVVPAAVVRALNRGGVPRSSPIWVGVCVAPAHGDWVRTADTFDRDRGCAGWVPDRRAASVGVLSTESSIPFQTWMTVLFGLAIAVLIAAAVARARVRPLNRVRHLWLVPVAVLGVSIVGGVVLWRVERSASKAQEVFGSNLEDAVHDFAVSGVTFAFALIVAALITTVWTLSQPDAVDHDRSSVRRP